LQLLLAQRFRTTISLFSKTSSVVLDCLDLHGSNQAFNLLAQINEAIGSLRIIWVNESSFSEGAVFKKKCQGNYRSFVENVTFVGQGMVQLTARRVGLLPVE
jgi:hypothetical protein